MEDEGVSLTVMDGADEVMAVEGALIAGTLLGAEGWLTEIVGTSEGRFMTGALKLWPRVIEGGSLTEMLGTAWVVETLLKRPRGGAVVDAGESLTEIVGMGGVTPMAGMLPDRPWPETGVSLTEMEGMLETDCGLLNLFLLAGLASLTAMLGMGGWGLADEDGSAYGSAGSG